MSNVRLRPDEVGLEEAAERVVEGYSSGMKQRLALAHLITALIWAVTIIGLPFAWAHLKLAGLALWPIGKAIVPA